MKIVSFTAENIKRLTAVHIKPNGAVVEITGKNGQGKTSVLDSIWWAIAGTGNVQSQPIRKGESRASIKLDLGEIIVTRSFSKKDDGEYTTSLSVRGADGSSFKSPQAVLDGLAGVLSFDPLAFSRMKPKDQFDALRAFVPGVDFEKVDAQNRGDYERRTEANRSAKQLRASAEMIQIPSSTPAEPIDEAALVEELKAAGILNSDVERRKVLRARAAEDIERYRASAQQIIDSIDEGIAEIDLRHEAAVRGLEQQIEALQRQVEAAKIQVNTERGELRVKRTQQAAEATSEATALQGRLAAAGELPEPIDVVAIEKRINEARAINANVERARLKAVHMNTAQNYEREAEQLSGNIAARDNAKRLAIAAAKMPVPGLDFGDGVVLLNGVPFEQASDAERLRASVAIAMAANPKLRVIRIRDGSLLDEDAMKILEAIAIERDFQVWIERVDSSGQVGFVLEDGHVREAQASERSAA